MSTKLMLDLMVDRDALIKALTYADTLIPDRNEMRCHGMKCRLPQCMSCQADPVEVDWSALSPKLLTVKGNPYA